MSLRRVGMLLGCLVLLLTPVRAAKDPPWKQFVSADGRFSVKFPGVPKTSQQSDNSPLGQVNTCIFSCSAASGTYSVSYSDIPGMAATLAEGRVFDGARDGLLKDAGATALSYVDAARGQDDGKQLVYQSAKVWGKAWLIMVGNRLYVADARLARKSPKTLADTFLKSLQTVSNE